MWIFLPRCMGCVAWRRPHRKYKESGSRPWVKQFRVSPSHSFFFFLCRFLAVKRKLTTPVPSERDFELLPQAQDGISLYNAWQLDTNIPISLPAMSVGASAQSLLLDSPTNDLPMREHAFRQGQGSKDTSAAGDPEMVNNNDFFVFPNGYHDAEWMNTLYAFRLYPVCIYCNSLHAG